MPWPAGAQPIVPTGDQTQPIPETQQPNWDVAASNAIGEGMKGALKGIGSTANAIGHIVYPDWLAKHLTGAPSEEQQQSYFKPANTAQRVGKGVEQAAEFLLPAGAEEEAARLLPKATQGVGRIGLSALSSGAINKAQGGGFGTGAAMGAGGAALGQGIRAAAPALAETALKVRGNQRLFGRTVGDAILNDTSGIRPERVARTAKGTIDKLEPELNAADIASASRGERGSLAPARESVGGKIAGLKANRATETAGHLKPVSDFLTRDKVTGLPLSENQAAPGLRAMKRGLNTDFIGNWSPTQPPAQKGAAREAYGLLNQELHRISPETAALDQRISSLIPVSQQGERVASEAPFVQRAIGRIARPTGGLAPAITGGYIGSREGGIRGGVVGGLLGLTLPELVASPEGQLALARAMSHASSLRPLVGSALQLTRKRDEEEQ